MKAPRTFADNLADTDRLAMAKQRADRLVDHVSTLFTLNEANRLVIYSDTLSKQIPRSYAANAFHQFQMSMHLFELIRLCALWDKPSTDRESIPTIIGLINKTEIIDIVATDTHRFYATELTAAHLTPFSSPEHEAAYNAWWDEERRSRAETEETKVREWLESAREKAEITQSSPELAALRHFRDVYIAHNLSRPELPPNTPNEVIGVKYGDENKLLEVTVQIADKLHLALNGTSYDWDGSREIAASNAKDLWQACRFTDVQTRRSSQQENRNFILQKNLDLEENE